MLKPVVRTFTLENGDWLSHTAQFIRKSMAIYTDKNLQDGHSKSQSPLNEDARDVATGISKRVENDQDCKSNDRPSLHCNITFKI
ncbi:hypothetical protein [Desulfocastanea catecholica]